MSFCTNCGAQLGFGRFCTNCGTPVAPLPDPSATESDVETTSVRLPRVQPDASGGARFPLYAAPTDTPPVPATDPVPPPPQAPSSAPAPAEPTAYPMVAAVAEPTPAGGRRDRRNRRRSPWPWVAAALVLLLGGVGAAWAVFGDEDEDRGTDRSAAATDPTPTPSDPTSAPTPTETPSPTIPVEPDGEPADLAAEARVKAPKPTAPGTSVSGETVSYPPQNMLDGDPSTAYRIDGNAAGTTITFTFDAPVTIREIGMINGYAKSEGKGAKRRDWYASNRKVTLVEWAFDDGTVAEQRLRETTDLQVMRVAATPTRTVRLTLVKVSAPGPDPRNTTAISSVLLRGQR